MAAIAVSGLEVKQQHNARPVEAGVSSDTLIGNMLAGQWRNGRPPGESRVHRITHLAGELKTGTNPPRYRRRQWRRL